MMQLRRLSRSALLAVAIEVVLFAALCVEYDHQGGLHGGGTLLLILILIQLPGILAGMLVSFIFHLAGDGSALDRIGSTLFPVTILAAQVGLVVLIARLVERSRLGGAAERSTNDDPLAPIPP